MTALRFIMEFALLISTTHVPLFLSMSQILRTPGSIEREEKRSEGIPDALVTYTQNIEV